MAGPQATSPNLANPIYYCEFGIDWESVEKGGHYFLQPGFSSIRPGYYDEIRPDDPTGMSVGGIVKVLFFDTTPSGADTASVDSFQWAWVNARTGEEKGPFSPGNLVEEQDIAGFPGEKQSVALRGHYPAWTVALPGLAPEEPESFEFEIAESARGQRFFYTASVDVTRKSDGSKRTFKVDPEMEVGENGHGMYERRGCLPRLLR